MMILIRENTFCKKACRLSDEWGTWHLLCDFLKCTYINFKPASRKFRMIKNFHRHFFFFLQIPLFLLSKLIVIVASIYWLSIAFFFLCISRRLGADYIFLLLANFPVFVLKPFVEAIFRYSGQKIHSPEILVTYSTVKETSLTIITTQVNLDFENSLTVSVTVYFKTNIQQRRMSFLFLNRSFQQQAAT